MHKSLNAKNLIKQQALQAARQHLVLVADSSFDHRSSLHGHHKWHRTSSNPLPHPYHCNTTRTCDMLMQLMHYHTHAFQSSLRYYTASVNRIRLKLLANACIEFVVLYAASNQSIIESQLLLLL